MPSHRIIHPELKKRLAATPVAPAWPSYIGTSQFVGTTPDGRCTVYYDPSLGEPCHLNAMQLLSDAPRIMAFNDATFGTPGGHVDVIIFALGDNTNGQGGADHLGCDFASGAQIEVCASFGQGQRVSALFEAELSECSMSGGA